MKRSLTSKCSGARDLHFQYYPQFPLAVVVDSTLAELLILTAHHSLLS